VIASTVLSALLLLGAGGAVASASIPGFAPSAGDVRPSFHDPKVVGSKPVNNSGGVALDLAVQITWDSNMDPATTVPAFSIAPAVTGATTQVWMKNLWFNHTDLFTVDTNYTVKVLKSATSTDGHPMPADYILKFTTAAAPKVTANSPAKDATNVSVNASVVIDFDTKMDPTSTEAASTLVPGTTLGFAWDATGKRMTAKPTAPLGEGTKYTFTVSGSAKSAAGPALTNPHSFDFTTETKSANLPPKVQTTSPAHGATAVARDAPVTITFSLPMDPATTVAAFSLSPAVGGGTPAVNGVALTFTHTETFSASTKYTVTVTGDAKSSVGVKMGASHSFDFTTAAAPAPTVLHTHPPNGATGIPVSELVKIHFDLAMDHGSTESAISASPALTGTFAWEPADDEVAWDPTPDMQPGVKYTFTVSTGAKSADLVPLAKAFVFTLTTEGTADTTPPLIVHAAVASAKAGTAIGIEATVTDDVGVDAVKLHYKKPGAAGFATLAMSGSGSKYASAVPAAEVDEGDLFYYIEASDASGNKATDPTGGSSSPHKVVVSKDGTGGGGGGGSSAGGIFGMGATMDLVIPLAIVLAIAGTVLAVLMAKRKKRAHGIANPWQPPGHPQQYPPQGPWDQGPGNPPY
jgi:hypothetical protein